MVKRIFGYLLMVAGVLGLVLTHSVLSNSPAVIAAQCLAVALMLWARITFGLRSFHAAANPTEGGLITSGPYRFIRHPIYSAVVIFSLAGALAHLSLATVGFEVAVLLGALARIFAEERLLKISYPEYADYAARTKRMLPWVF